MIIKHNIAFCVTENVNFIWNIEVSNDCQSNRSNNDCNIHVTFFTKNFIGFQNFSLILISFDELIAIINMLQ